MELGTLIKLDKNEIWEIENIAKPLLDATSRILS